GVFHLAAGVGPADVERALQAFERAGALAPGNVYVQQDIAAARAVLAGEPVPTVTYVIVESGLAPRREEMRIDLPLFVFGGPVDYVGVALPRLQPVRSGPSSLRIGAEGMWHAPAVLADMADVVGQSLE